MTNKMTIEEGLLKRKVNRPGFEYAFLCNVVKAAIYKKYNITLTIKNDPRKYNGPHIMIGNHASRADYVFYGFTLLPNRYNFVLGHNEFYRSHLKLILRILNAIPKKNFVSDYYTMKTIKRILKEGGNICIMPEGMSSISGANQPVAIGTGKFIKSCKVPVYYGITKGGYLTNTKYNLDERYGKVEVIIDRMFSPKELEDLSPEEIEDKMNALLYHDDYEWNKEHKYRYDCKGNPALGLHTLLYKCPKCFKEHTMKSDNTRIFCTECGNGATIDDSYQMTPFDSKCIIPKTQTQWFNWERNVCKEEIKKEGFILKEHVKIGILPEYEYLKGNDTAVIVGEGNITLTRDGFDFDGTREGKPFSFHIDPAQLPTYGMCTDVSRFYTFATGEFIEFYPEHETVEKWLLCTEEIHRLNGGKWQDFKFDVNSFN